MNYLLHGDDTAASRKRLLDLTSDFTLTTLDGKNLSLKDLETELASNSLFSEKRAVVVENLLSKNPKKKEFLSLINEYKGESLLVLWEDKKLAKSAQPSSKLVTIQEFTIPSYYFQFLDSFTPSQSKKVFVQYHELIKTYEPEQVFYSLIKRLRHLLILSQNATTEEISKMQDWQILRLKKQASYWSFDKLSTFYNKLQETEINLKSGKLPVSLSKHLDILILSEL